jgi:hypothetical protein
LRKDEIALSLHDDSDLRRLERIVQHSIEKAECVCVDFSAPTSRAPLGLECREVGRAGPQSKVAARVARSLGVSYATYHTCVVATASDVIVVARDARNGGEFRLRVFASRPDDTVLFGWKPVDLWDPKRRRAEEERALLVLTAVNDGTAMLVGGPENQRLLHVDA